jgi:predicted O-methyltransferase YrrM
MQQQETWSAVDRYFNELLIGADPAGEAALRASSAAGLPEINVTASQGKLLMMLARLCNARRILEIGTLGGYSTIWLTRALPGDGKVVTLEHSEKHAACARANFAAAGVADKVELIVGKAIDALPKLAALGQPFDFVFIDADKVSTPQYFEWSLKMSRPGTTIIVDNVVREGNIIDAASSDASVQGVRRFNEMVAKDKRVMATAIQTVGSKGYDGFAMAVVQ